MCIHFLAPSVYVKYSNESIGDRTRDIPACSEVHFIAPEGSVSYPYPDPDESSPYFLPHFFKKPLEISYWQRLSIPSGFLPLGLPTKTLYIFIFFPHACHKPRPSQRPLSDHLKNVW